MQTAKKIACTVLALAMVFSIALPVFAADDPTRGSITIHNASPGEEYKAYKIFDLESFDPYAEAYSYKVTHEWEQWLRTQEDFFILDEQGYVRWNEKPGETYEQEQQRLQEFTRRASEEVKYNTYNYVNPVIYNAPDEQGYVDIAFPDLELGYWLIDTSLGTYNMLYTVTGDIESYEKNEIPTVNKTITGINDVPYEIKDNPYTTGEKENTASVGDKIDYKTVITAQPGAMNYVLHDRMSNGLLLVPDTIKVTAVTKAEAEWTYYPDGTPLVEDIHYTVAYNPRNSYGKQDTTDECTFEIKFDEKYLDTISEDTYIIVTYSAYLTEEAVDGYPSDLEGKYVIPNETRLDYGDHSSTEWDQTKTYTFTFDVVKTDEANKILDGAEFMLYDAETDGNIIPVHQHNETYIVSMGSDPEYSSPIQAGITTVKGLASGTYWLEEVKAPDGYNKMPGRQKIFIDNANIKAELSADNTSWVNGGVHIVNKTGPVMPSTGGIGTTIFYIVGAALLVGAGVLLVVRRRMNASKDTDK